MKPSVTTHHGSSRTAHMWLLAALLLAFALHLWAAGTEDRQSPDTFHYARQATALRHQGLDAWRDEAGRFVNDPAMLAIPPVTRTVFLTAVAGWMELTQSEGVASVAAFSCIVDLVAVALLAWFAADLLGRTAAAAVVLLYTVSPTTLSIARHGWSDTCVGLICLVNLVLAMQCLQRTAAWWPSIGFAISLALSFGVKEAPFVQGCLVLAIVLVWLWREKRIPDALRLLVLSAVSMATVIAWTAYAVGGIGRVLQMYGSARDVHAAVPYLVLYQNGSSIQWIQAVWIADPIVVSLAAFGIGWTVLHTLRAQAEYKHGLVLCAAICVVFPLLPMLGHQLYNVRFLTPAYAPACVLAIFGLRELGSRTMGPAALRVPVAVGFLAVCAAISLHQYQTLIAVPDLQDLSLRMMLTRHN